MTTPDLDTLAWDLHTGTAPALVRAVHQRDERAVHERLAGLDVLQLRALVVVLADLIPDRVFDLQLRALDAERPVPAVLAGLVRDRPASSYPQSA
jgi:hypothetical protein